MAAIAGFRVVDVAANLSLVQMLPRLSPLLGLLPAAAIPPHQLYCYLLPLLLLLYLLPVLTAKWKATLELL